MLENSESAFYFQPQGLIWLRRAGQNDCRRWNMIGTARVLQEFYAWWTVSRLLQYNEHMSEVSLLLAESSRKGSFLLDID